jgi:DHA2 family methylenomycin A resistance protein-like MFS transporter
MLFAGLFSGHLSDRHSPRKLYLIFNAIAIASFALMALFSVDTGMALILIALVLMGLGIAASFPPNNKQVLLRFPRELQGEGSGTVMALRVVGQTVGTAVMVTVFQSFFYPGHESKADLASGFSTAILVALAMLAISLVLVYLTSDPEAKESGEKLVVV